MLYIKLCASVNVVSYIDFLFYYGDKNQQIFTQQFPSVQYDIVSHLHVLCCRSQNAPSSMTETWYPPTNSPPSPLICLYYFDLICFNPVFITVKNVDVFMFFKQHFHEMADSLHNFQYIQQN